MTDGFSRGGIIPGPPLTMTARPTTPCVCGLPTYRFDGGPAEHIITKEVSADLAHWVSRCPLLQATFSHRGPGLARQPHQATIKPRKRPPFLLLVLGMFMVTPLLIQAVALLMRMLGWPTS